MAVLFGASLVGLVLGVVFLAERRPIDRFTELYFVSHKVQLDPLSGTLDLNYTGAIAHGELFGRDFWVLGPETDEEILVFLTNGKETQIKIHQTFRLGDTYLLFAGGATDRECLFYEYSREVKEFEKARMRFAIENKLKRNHTYYYKTYLGSTLVDAGEVPVKAGECKYVISSFPVGTTENEWTRVYVVLDTGENISFAFRTYS